MKIKVETTMGDIIVDNIEKIIIEEKEGCLKLLNPLGFYTAKLDYNCVLSIMIIHKQPEVAT